MTRKPLQPGAAVASAMRLLPVAGKPGHPPPGEIAAGQRFERQIMRVHALGPRPLAELLDELSTATGQPALIADRVEAYAGLNPEIVRAIGADRFPPMPLEVVR